MVSISEFTKKFGALNDCFGESQTAVQGTLLAITEKAQRLQSDRKRAGSTVYAKQLRIAMMLERNQEHQPWQFNHDSNRTNTNATHQT